MRPATYTDGDDWSIAVVALDRLRRVFASASMNATKLDDKVAMQRAVKSVELMRLDLRKLHFVNEDALGKFHGTPKLETCGECGALKQCQHRRPKT